MFELLLKRFGPQSWWPGEDALEMMVGAILTQNTSWKNVSLAIENLKARNLLCLEALHALPAEALAAEIRPAGYFNVKARRLKNLIAFIVERYQGDIALLGRVETESLRQGLLSVKGVGPETADSILLYALDRPVFVIDAYTHRILSRHAMVEEASTYDELQALFMDHLPDDAQLFNEFHALIVRNGKEFCRRLPLCADCALQSWGPANLCL